MIAFYRVALCQAEVDKCRSCTVLVLFFLRIISLKCIDFGEEIIKGAGSMVKKLNPLPKTMGKT